MRLLDEFVWDDNGALTIARYGGWLVQVMSMIVNDRLVLTPENDTMGYDYGWCFPKGLAPIAAARIWDADNEGEPVGYLKAINKYLGFPREPGEHAGVTFEEKDHNSGRVKIR
jgi:hypothetical protein